MKENEDQENEWRHWSHCHNSPLGINTNRDHGKMRRYIYIAVFKFVYVVGRGGIPESKGESHEEHRESFKTGCNDIYT